MYVCYFFTLKWMKFGKEVFYTEENPSIEYFKLVNGHNYNASLSVLVPLGGQ